MLAMESHVASVCGEQRTKHKKWALCFGLFLFFYSKCMHTFVGHLLSAGFCIYKLTDCFAFGVCACARCACAKFISLVKAMSCHTQRVLSTLAHTRNQIYPVLGRHINVPAK